MPGAYMQVDVIDFNLPMQMTLSLPPPTVKEKIAMIVEEISEQNASLRHQLDELAKENETLQLNIKPLRLTLVELRAENRRLQAENNMIKTGTYEEYNNLLEENNKRLSECQIDYETVKQENSDLRQVLRHSPLFEDLLQKFTASELRTLESALVQSGYDCGKDAPDEVQRMLNHFIHQHKDWNENLTRDDNVIHGPQLYLWNKQNIAQLKRTLEKIMQDNKNQTLVCKYLGKK
jgi:regulator of replication initiation timing